MYFHFPACTRLSHGKPALSEAFVFVLFSVAEREKKIQSLKVASLIKTETLVAVPLVIFHF